MIESPVETDRLVGALVVGEQTLADPLRDLIEKQIDIHPLRPHLQEGGPGMAQRIMQFWAQLKARAKTGQPMPTRPYATVTRTD